MSDPQCCANPPTLNSSSGIGYVEEVGGLKTYITGSLDSKLGIVLISDIFGVVIMGIFIFYFTNLQCCQALNEELSGPQCCANPPTLNSSSGIGYVEDVGGLKTYITGCLDSKLGIVLISDIFGYEAPLLRKLADKVAAAGYYVVVPDFFYGDPFVPDNSERPIPTWLKDHGTDKGTEDVKPVIEALKSKGISAIGAAGFCWGGKVVVNLAKTDAIKAGVMLHPSFVTVDDIKEVKAPLAILGAEIDKNSPPELLKQFEEVLSTKPEVDSIVKIFPGVAHGWTVRYDDANKAAVKSAEEAHQDMLNWFSKYVK